VSACAGWPTRRGCHERGGGRVVAAQALRAAPHGVGAIEVAADGHAEPRAGAAGGLRAELQGDALEDNDIVEADGALFLLAQDDIQIDGPKRHEGRVWVRRRAGELGVVVGDEVLTQVGVGPSRRW